jgi:hypothetical protein
MKNIFILPTNKPSRLWTNNLRRRLELDEFPEQHPTNIAKHIYITSDEKVKEGDWCLSKLNEAVRFGKKFTESLYKKIILTTDPQLIADGVQAIDDEFLEWFVKNPGCEEVEVGYGWIRLTETNNEGYWVSIPDNQFEMQQAEPKQECTCENPTDNTCGYCEKENKIEILEEAKKRALEEETLEEAANRLFPISKGGLMWMPSTHDCNQANKQEGFIAGAKYMAKRMYTEEDMIKFAEFVASYPDKNRNYLNQMLHAKSKYDGSERTIDLFGIWFKQFKKK